MASRARSSLAGNGWVPALLLLLSASMMSVSALSAQAPSQPLRTLTKAKQAHGLSLEEARRSYPIHLKAVVTYYDPFLDSRRPVLFVHDSSGSIFVALTSFPTLPLHAGSLVEIQGVSAAGDFAPIVDKASLQFLGNSSVPAYAPHVSLSQLLTGVYDGQWVEVKGIVHSIEESGQNLILDLATSDGSLAVTTIKQPGADYTRLVDAEVKIHANAGPQFNRRRQLTGAHLLVPSLDQIMVEKPAAVEPFQLPLSPVDKLLRFSPTAAFGSRIHVRGAVTLQWPGRSLCIQSGVQGLCIQTSLADHVGLGDIVDVVGFPEVSGFSPTLSDALFRPSGATQHVVAEPVTAAQALSGDYDARQVEIVGKLIGEDHQTKDRTMVLSSGKFLFPVVLPASSVGGAMPKWEVGSILRIAGVCSVQVEASKHMQQGFSVPASFRILLRSPADVVVVQRASWWTPSHLLPVLALALAVTLSVLGWVAVLRYRIAAQAMLIRKQNAILQNLSFEDGLTGVANRRKFDETLRREFQKALKSSTPISLLMMDIDHFKALNDSYGHQRGDECLARIAKALASSTSRPTHLLARYGGEEFAMIMPGYVEKDAVATGERMRTAVSSLSIVHAGSPFNASVSISVGAATLIPNPTATAASLVALADKALYQSKLAGRNRTTFCAADRVGFGTGEAAQLAVTACTPVS